MNLQDWVAGLNKRSHFNRCHEFKTALNAEMYLDCVKQKAIRDCLVCVRLGTGNLIQSKCIGTSTQEVRYCRTMITHSVQDFRTMNYTCSLCPRCTKE